MKVKVGELKTHLSSYLRKVEEDGETLEVCVRERPVAYLVPAPADGAIGDATRGLTGRLQAQGLVVAGLAAQQAPAKLGAPRLAGDGRSDRESVREMRGGKDW